MRKYYLIKNTGSLLKLKTRSGKLILTTPNQVERHLSKNEDVYFYTLKKDRVRNRKLINAVICVLGGIAIAVEILLALHSSLDNIGGYYQESNNTEVHYEWVNED